MTTVPFRISDAHQFAPMRCSQDLATAGQLSTRSMVMQSSTGHTSAAEIAADAFVFIHARNARERAWTVLATTAAIQLRDRRARRCARGSSASDFAGRCRAIARDAIQMNALMRAIPAGDVAQLAADAFLRMDARDDLVIQIRDASTR